jgi:hypothetical protein
MATLHAAANGNYTTAATWGVVNAASLLDIQGSNSVLTTAFVSSATFTPGAVTVDGIAVKIASRAASPSGTMSVRLAQGGVAVAGTTVTINVSDLPDESVTPGAGVEACSIGWWFFKFAAPVNLVAATLYTVQATTSVAGQVNLFRNPVAGDWCRMLRTTATAAPAAGDNVFVGGEWTAAATMTARTVTYDGTASTDFGGASLTLASVGISTGGTITAATTASTALIWRLSGVLQVWIGGTLALGTAGTPIPSSSSLLLEFDCAADGDFGIVNHGTVETNGSPRTAGKEFSRTRLTANLAAAGTSATVADDTGWLNGDVVALAATYTAATQAEIATLNADAGASSLSFAAVTNGHEGDATNERQADVILLTRNVRITVVNTSFYGYQSHRGTSWATTWTEFSRLGTTAATKSGFNLPVNGSTATFTHCSIAFTKGSWTTTTLANHVITYTDCVMWRIGESVQGFLFVNTSGSSNLTLMRCTMLGNGAGSNHGMYQGGTTGFCALFHSRFSGIVQIPCRIDSGQLRIEDCEWYLCGDINGCILSNSNVFGAVIKRSKFWRIVSGSSVCNMLGSWEIIDCDFYGNASESIDATGCDEGRVVNCRFNSLPSYNAPSGLNLQEGRIEVNNCYFGVLYLDRTALTGTSIVTNNQLIDIILVNCETNGTEVSGTPATGSRIGRQNDDGVAAVHSYRQYGHGTLTIETTVVGDSSPSIKLTPEAKYREFRTNLFTKQINSGQTATWTAKLRKTAAYNGENPRLMLVANGSIGVATDAVLATLAAAADTWETVTGAMPSPATQDGVVGVWVECNGTAGDVYVDDIAVTVA